MRFFLVDVDDTILDFQAANRHALSLFCAHYSIPYNEKVQATYSAINDALWKQLERGEITKPELIHTRFSRFLTAVGCSADPLHANEIYFSLVERCPDILEGAIPFLEELRKRGTVYFITNGTARVQRSRQMLSGIDRYAVASFISEELGANKPAKAFFDDCLAQIPHTKEDSFLVIGDTLSSDILGANNADLPSVWLNRKGEQAIGATPTFVATSYAEILNILDNV